MELKECVHSILVIPTCKLYTPITPGSLYRVTAQSHVKAESPGGGDSDATHFSSYTPPGGVHLCSLLTLIFGSGPSFSLISTWLTSADHRTLFFQLSQPHSLWSCLLVPSGPPDSSGFCFPKTVAPSSLFLLEQVWTAPPSAL